MPQSRRRDLLQQVPSQRQHGLGIRHGAIAEETRDAKMCAKRIEAGARQLRQRRSGQAQGAQLRRAQRLPVRQRSAQERQAEAQVMAHQHAAANSVGYRLCFAIDAWLAA